MVLGGAITTPNELRHIRSSTSSCCNQFAEDPSSLVMRGKVTDSSAIHACGVTGVSQCSHAVLRLPPHDRETPANRKRRPPTVTAKAHCGPPPTPPHWSRQVPRRSGGRWRSLSSRTLASAVIGDWLKGGGKTRVECATAPERCGV